MAMDVMGRVKRLRDGEVRIDCTKVRELLDQGKLSRAQAEKRLEADEVQLSRAVFVSHDRRSRKKSRAHGKHPGAKRECFPPVDTENLEEDARGPAARGGLRGKGELSVETDHSCWVQRDKAPQIRHLDIRPVPGFTGREELLADIDRCLWGNKGIAVLINSSISAAVKGLGGVGKSVLAREYAWRARERYRGVWWVRAETEQTIIDDLIDLGSRLIPHLQEVEERDRALHLALNAIAEAGGTEAV